MYQSFSKTVEMSALNSPAPPSNNHGMFTQD